MSFITGFSNLTQSTFFAVSTETGLKAVGRPLFTLHDKSVDMEARKYSATKELLYQGLCFGMYLTAIPFIFKPLGFQIFKKMYKDAPEFSQFKKLKHFNQYWNKPQEYVDTLIKNGDAKAAKEINKIGKEGFRKVKGSVELVSIISSVLALTLIAPALGNKIIHPLMNVLGIKSKKGE